VRCSVSLCAPSAAHGPGIPQGTRSNGTPPVVIRRSTSGRKKANACPYVPIPVTPVSVFGDPRGPYPGGGQREQRHAEFLRDDRIYRAIEALTEEVRTRQAQDRPMSKTEAITFLRARELTREDARKHIDRWAGKRWTLEQIREGAGKQAAYVLRPRPTAVMQVS
jgi:hypothetical protein